MKRAKVFCATMTIIISVLVILTPIDIVAIEPASTTKYNGIDVSRYQGDIDFAKVKQAGYTVVYIRAGEGIDFVDPYFEQNYEMAKAVGMDIGFYYYVTAQNETEAIDQASTFAKLIKDKDYSARPAIDFEEFGGLGDTEINSIALTFAKTLESATKVTPLFYTDAYSAEVLWSEELYSYPLWVADYGDNIGSVSSAVWSEWVGYQYSDEGKIDGIEGNVDLDYFTAEVLLTSAEREAVKNGNTTNVPTGSEKIYYTVKAGDTLWSIANRYDVSVGDIAISNSISDINLIYVGEVLTIPLDTARYATYTVKAGDTLWSIANRYGVSVGAIATASGISDINLIYIGENLKIPIG